MYYYIYYNTYHTIKASQKLSFTLDAPDQLETSGKPYMFIKQTFMYDVHFPLLTL